jgi:hypothetical protein
MSGSEEQFGAPDERLRQTLERELGQVPPGAGTPNAATARPLDTRVV